MIGIQIAGKSSITPKSNIVPIHQGQLWTFSLQRGSRGWVLHPAGCSVQDGALSTAVGIVHGITITLQWHQQPEHPREGIAL